MRRVRIVGLVTLTLAACSAPNVAEPLDASNESRALAAFIEGEYSEFLTDFLHVYLGYASCSYEFIDEDILNSLADDGLRAMTSRGVSLIREEHDGAPGGLSDRAVEYASSMAVLTTMEMWSNALTAEISEEYAGENFECGTSTADNQARYEAMQRFEVG